MSLDIMWCKRASCDDFGHHVMSLGIMGCHLTSCPPAAEISPNVQWSPTCMVYRWGTAENFYLQKGWKAVSTLRDQGRVGSWNQHGEKEQICWHGCDTRRDDGVKHIGCHSPLLQQGIKNFNSSHQLPYRLETYHYKYRVFVKNKKNWNRSTMQ